MADRSSIADELFREGRELMNDGEIAAACNKFAASMRAEASVGALVNLARCHELEGKTASAQREYREAATLAEASGEKQRADAARKLAGDLESKVSRLSVQIDEPLEGLVVLLDGRDVSDAVESPIPVDPGSHRIEATAPGRAPYTTTMSVSDGADRRTVVVPALEPVGGSDTAADPPPQASDGTWSTVGWMLMGLGATATVAGAIVGATVLVDADEARANPSLCPGEVCSPAGDAYLDELDGRAAGATALIVVGGAMTVAGLVTALVADDGVDDSAAGMPAVRVALGPASLALIGSF